MYVFFEPYRYMLFLNRFELEQSLEKIAKAQRKANPGILVPAHYDIPSLIWPPPTNIICRVRIITEITCGSWGGLRG